MDLFVVVVVGVVVVVVVVPVVVPFVLVAVIGRRWEAELRVSNVCGKACQGLSLFRPTSPLSSLVDLIFFFFLLLSRCTPLLSRCMLVFGLACDPQHGWEDGLACAGLEGSDWVDPSDRHSTDDKATEDRRPPNFVEIRVISRADIPERTKQSCGKLFAKSFQSSSPFFDRFRTSVGQRSTFLAHLF